MIRMVAVSDTHLEETIPESLVELTKNTDLVIHAGDFVTMEVYEAFTEMGELEAVCGNSDSTDLREILPERKVIEVEEIRLGLVHMASYSSNLNGVGFLAREMNVDALIFGHIHRPYVERGSKLLICPGSPTMPKMSPPTVAEIKVRGKEINGRIIPLGKPTCNYIRCIESLD
ncbi:MAG: metallophosphoesterase [Methanotrichaceae archaeon]